MKILPPVLFTILYSTSFAGEPWKGEAMQQAVLVEQDLAKIKALVQTGVDPSAPIGCGTYAPLDGAIRLQNTGMVDLLLSLGAKPTERQIVAAAFCASHDEALKIVIALHKAGAPINARDYYSGDKSRYTMPLHNAVWRGNIELTAFLLKQRGILLNETNIDDYTPLMIAVEHVREDLVDILLAAGADPKKKNKAGLDAEAISNKVIEKQTQLKIKLKMIKNNP